MQLRIVLLALLLAASQAVEVDLLGEPVERQGDPAVAPAQPAAPAPDLRSDFLGEWRLQGPFPGPLAGQPLGAEPELRKSPPLAQWRKATADPANAGDWLRAVLGRDLADCFAYAVAAVESPVEQPAELLIGSDDGYHLWLNGAAVGGNPDVIRPVRADQDRHPVKLRRGRNLLLVKIRQAQGGWGMCVRFGGLLKPVRPVAP